MRTILVLNGILSLLFVRAVHFDPKKHADFSGAPEIECMGTPDPSEETVISAFISIKKDGE